MKEIYDKKYRVSNYKFLCIACNTYILPGDTIVQLNKKSEMKLRSTNYIGRWIHNSCNQNCICMTDIHPDFIISSSNKMNIDNNYIINIT